jgi:hypothetical protein
MFKRLFISFYFGVVSVFFVKAEDTKSFSLFPIPVKSEKVSVKLANANTNIVSFELRNLVGRKLQEKAVPRGADEISFDEMSGYPNGIYVVMAKDVTGKVIEISKFVINK